jgi:hypothetical protein
MEPSLRQKFGRSAVRQQVFHNPSPFEGWEDSKNAKGDGPKPIDIGLKAPE